MAEIVADLSGPAIRLAAASGEPDAPLFGRQEPRHDAQQRRFSGAIPAGQDQGLASAQAKGNIIKKQVVAPSCGQAFGAQLHEWRLSLLARRNRKKLSDLPSHPMASFREVIYIIGNTPAVGVNFILVPNLQLISLNFTCGQRKWPYPHPDVHFSA
jgi:hypothetical protein